MLSFDPTEALLCHLPRTWVKGVWGILLRSPKSAASCLILAMGNNKMAEILGKEKLLLKVLQGSTLNYRPIICDRPVQFNPKAQTRP